jgi:hypothetical protein
MKLNIKTLSLVILLGTVFYFLSNKKNNSPILVKTTTAIPESIVNDKTSKLVAPKVNSLSSAKNYLIIKDNWRSR